MIDSTTTQIDSLSVLKNNILILNSKIDSLESVADNVHSLNSRIDSIISINKDLMVNKNYFSDVIDTQMDWFALIFVITFGILGLAYWLGIMKYFKNKFSSLNSDLITTKNSLISRMNQIYKTTQAKTLSNYTILDNKISSLEKIQTELNNQKFETINADIKEIQKDITEMISTTENDIKTIIEKQNNDFKEEKDSILRKLWITNFDTQRSMFFYCYNDENYSSALTWIIPMMDMIVDELVTGFDLELFIERTEECISKAKIDETFTERFDNFNEMLFQLENKIEDENNKDRIKQIRLLLNKTYYTQAEIKNDENSHE